MRDLTVTFLAKSGNFIPWLREDGINQCLEDVPIGSFLLFSVISLDSSTLKSLKYFLSLLYHKRDSQASRLCSTVQTS